MFFLVYKITNKLNDKFYIGKHQTKNLDDGYMGSGKLLKQAIKKYGPENFTKEILFVFDNEQDMNAKEKELVVLGENSYNLCPGGHGGWGYLHLSGIINYSERGRQGIINRTTRARSDPKYAKELSRTLSEKFQQSDKVKAKTISKETQRLGTEAARTEKVKAKRRATQVAIGFQKGVKNSQYGKPRSEETKRKISETLKNKNKHKPI